MYTDVGSVSDTRNTTPSPAKSSLVNYLRTDLFPHHPLLLTGDIPNEDQVQEVIEDFQKRGEVPQYVWDVLRAMPKDTHPMTMFSAAVLAMQRDSEFVKKYNAGMSKMDYWDPMYEDAMNLQAKLHTIAAHIYRYKYKNDSPIDPDFSLDYKPLSIK